MTEKEKTTPIVSVGTDTEQSILKHIDNSITEFKNKIKAYGRNGGDCGG